MASLDQLFTFEITCSKYNTAMAAFVYLTAVSVSCLLFAPVTEATTRLSRFSNTGLDSLVFTSNVLFETTSRSVLDCGRQCVRDARCVTFTRVKGSSSGSCRGHAVIFKSTSAHFVSATGATTFSWTGKLCSMSTCTTQLST